MTSTQPEWPAVGDKVAVYTWFHTAGRVGFYTVKHLTATQVVLDNDQRFSRARLRQIGNGDGELRKLDDPAVLSAVAAAAISRLHSLMAVLLRDGAKDPVHAADLLDRAEMLLADARRKIAGPSATPTAE